MVARHRSRLRVTLSPGVYDVVGVHILGLSASVKDPLPHRRPTLVRWSSCGANCVDGLLQVMCVIVVLCAGLMAYAGRRALGLLHGLLLDEGLSDAVQVAYLGRRGLGMARSSVATAMSFWLARGGVC
jgi:hypothetical protein